MLALADALHAARQDHRLTPALEARIVHLTQHAAPAHTLDRATAGGLRRSKSVDHVTPVTVDRAATGLRTDFRTLCHFRTVKSRTG